MAHVLIVDDEAGFRSVLREYLEGAGHSVVEAADGAGALATLDATPVDVVILDIFMPKMDGLELIPMIRKRPSAPPVIAMSGGAPSQPGAEPLHAAQLLGAVATLEKPFDLEALLAIVEEHRFKAL